MARRPIDLIAEITALSGMGLFFALGFLVVYALLSAVLFATFQAVGVSLDGRVVDGVSGIHAVSVPAAAIAGYAMFNVGLALSKHHPAGRAGLYMTAALMLLEIAALWRLFILPGRDLAEAWETQPAIVFPALAGMALAWFRRRPGAARPKTDLMSTRGLP